MAFTLLKQCLGVGPIMYHLGTIGLTSAVDVALGAFLASLSLSEPIGGKFNQDPAKLVLSETWSGNQAHTLLTRISTPESVLPHKTFAKMLIS